MGNIRDIGYSGQHTWTQYSDWASLYGEVIYLEIVGKPFIILNSAKATTELLDKRSSNYSDRPGILYGHLC